MRSKQHTNCIKTYMKVQIGDLNKITILRSYQNLNIIKKNMGSDEITDSESDIKVTKVDLFDETKIAEFKSLPHSNTL